MMPFRQFLRCLLLVPVFICTTVLAQDAKQEQLEKLQAELKERQQKLEASKSSAQELEAVLRQSELLIGEVAAALNKTEGALKDNKQEQARLTTRQNELKDAILKQQGLLASQLKSAFMAGHYDYAKMIFYQDDAQAFERVLTYYQYLNKARQKEILTFRDNVAQLQAVTAQLEQKADELETLRADQKAQQGQLLARQEDRKATLAKLNQVIASESAKVDALQASEQALVKAIEEAQRAAERAARQAKTRMAGLASSKGKLQVPAKGRVRRLFGERRQGQVRWKGIVIEGDEGAAVKAISGGRVLYADWLKGFGLVTIVDHGEGYMSVYGHNQALIKQAGDMVTPGETIALVGQSGGQNYPNLYFEIRHKGKALNPTSWLDI